MDEGCDSDVEQQTRRVFQQMSQMMDRELRVAGFIAMATHGRSGLARLVLGSVADEVIRHAHLPMLVYRPGAR